MKTEKKKKKRRFKANLWLWFKEDQILKERDIPLRKADLKTETFDIKNVSEIETEKKGN